MGKTKIKTIDDSAPVEEPKKKKDSLVDKLNAELGIEQKKEEIHPQPSIVKKPSSKIKHPTSKRVRSKKYQEVTKDLDKTQTYPLSDAIDIVKKMSYSKFNGTLEVHINTAQMGVRGLVSLPFASGKKLRILAFGSASKTDLTEVIFGDDSTIEAIEKGKVDFDLILTTPEWMPKLAKVARVLGPKGLMPNPKNNTITTDLKKAIENSNSQTEFKTETKAPIIHLGLGKLNQPTEELSQNIKTLLSAIGKSRIKKVTLSPTMGPSVKIDKSSI